jgi:hypothetical protein
MDKRTAEKLDREEDKKMSDLITKIFNMPSNEKRYENLVRVLYPEIPWKGKQEERGYLLPSAVPPWLVLPFYEKPILVIYPFDAPTFKMVYGLTSEEILELLNKRRIYATTRFGYGEFASDKYNHLDRILEKRLPHARWITFIEKALKRKKDKYSEFRKFFKEATTLDPEFGKHWDIYYGILSSFGMNRRLRRAHWWISGMCENAQRNYQASDFRLESLRLFRIGWLDMFFWEFFSPFFYGAVPVSSSQSYKLFSGLFGSPIAPNEGIVNEIAQELLVNIELVSATDPNDLDVDLIMKTQDNAKDLRKAYNEFASLVSRLKLKEALEVRDAVGYASEELKKSAPILDKTENITNVALTVSAAAMTAQASNLLLSSGMLSLIPAGISGSTILQMIRKKEIKEWLEGQYANLLHQFGVGPFAFAHTWRARKLVKKRRVGT